MAISWGPWEYSGGNGMRVGIEIEGWTEGDGSGDVNSGSGQAQTYVTYYTENQYSYSDTQTLTLSGAISGTVTFNNSQGGAVTQRARRLYEYDYGPNEYGSSPGNRTFTAKISGAFNGVTPSKSVTTSIPARPGGLPAAPTNVSVAYTSDGSQKVTWTNKSTTDAPWATVRIQRDIHDNAAWNGDVGTAGGSATSFTDSTTEADTKYRYRVRAENQYGESGWVESNVVWTTPDAPSDVVRTGNNGTNQVITWTNNVNYPEYVTQLWVSRDGVWDVLNQVADGITTYTHTEPASNPNVKYAYALRAFTTTASPTLYSDYVYTTSTTGASSPPNAPSNLSPSNSTIAPTATQTFSWTHNPTDGTAQTAYELRWRYAGDLTWNTIPVTSGTASYLMAANTFANDATVEWQVRTKGTHASYGAWSASVTFATSIDPSSIRQNRRPVILNTDTGEMETAARGVLPPVGALTPYAGDTAPSGWLLCQGQEVSQSTYADLFAVIGTKFGSASSGMFRLPDLRDRVPVGASGTKAAGTSGGSSTSTIGTANLPPHTHDSGTYGASGDGSHDHVTRYSTADGTSPNIIRTGTTTGYAEADTNQIMTSGAHSHDVAGFSGDGPGSSSPLSVQNPYVAMHYIIKT